MPINNPLSQGVTKPGSVLTPFQAASRSYDDLPRDLDNSRLGDITEPLIGAAISVTW